MGSLSFNIMKIKKYVQRINLILVISILAIALIAWLNDYISKSVFIRFISVDVCLLIIWIALIKIKLLNNLSIYLFVFLLFASVNIFDISFFFEINGFLIVVPDNYTGEVYIRTNDHKSGYSEKPFNKIVIFSTNSMGRLYTKTDINIPVDGISLAEFKGGSIVYPDQLELVNLKFTKHDSTDGNYNVIQGLVRIKK
jgi:hypothetical protein